MFFKKKENQNKDFTNALVFDFGSGSLKILVCRYTKEGAEIIDGRKLNYGSGNGILETVNILDAFRDPLAEKIAELTADIEKPEKAVIGVSGQRVEGYTSHINYRRARPDEKIDKAEFNIILQRVEQRADQLMRKMIAFETAAGNSVALTNSEVLEVTLDGYAVASPVGSHGEKISFVVYNGYAQGEFLAAATKLVETQGLDIVSTAPTVYAESRNLLESANPNASFCVIDIGEYASEIGVVWEGRILGHVSFGVAGHSFTESIASALQLDHAAAETAKFGFTAGKLTDKMALEIREAVEADCKVFLSGLELVLSDFPGLQEFPSQFYVCGGGSLLPAILSTLRSAEWRTDLAVPKKIRFDQANPALFRGYSDKSARLISPADTPTLTLALDATDLLI